MYSDWSGVLPVGALVPKEGQDTLFYITLLVFSLSIGSHR